jgi:hypothetical protein
VGFPSCSGFCFGLNLFIFENPLGELECGNNVLGIFQVVNVFDKELLEHRETTRLLRGLSL